ncbi:GNAT family N-acetyltransferase [Anaerosalibacter bizertensis]|uniref:GNAT family N-acetyltransferase n=1 Tax=Anaerosalibacter bizertensis TaxID=932217 RepID=UPI003516F4D6
MKMLICSGNIEIGIWQKILFLILQNHSPRKKKDGFFLKNKEYVGFAAYVIYHSEDGKCFIVEYCIEPKWRNQGLGTKFFQLIERKTLKNGASYFELNFSNEDNIRFWKSNGFIYAYKDEYGSEVYAKRYKEK